MTTFDLKSTPTEQETFNQQAISTDIDFQPANSDSELQRHTYHWMSSFQMISTFQTAQLQASFRLTYSAEKCFSEDVLCVAENEAGLSHMRVAYDDDLS